ncbi:MAG: polymer-forming cytoskeletal protein [Clostridia bacterium]|nr:polymer-forming cytoskeletal protein [Clostridia bacterium]
MDMKIAGSGTIGAGEYEKISISGSGRINGAIKCTNLSVSGSASGVSVDCKEHMGISGSCSFSEDVTTGNARIAGSFKCGGNFYSSGEVKCAGSAKFNKDLKCGNLELAGAIKVDGGIEAETVHIDGKIDCLGLINAEKTVINIENAISEIGSIGGGTLTVKTKFRNNLSGLFLRLFYKTNGKIIVTNEIECDMIDITAVTAPKVVGRIVKIGDDCKIDVVQYSEEVDISPKATVGKTEKI